MSGTSGRSGSATPHLSVIEGRADGVADAGVGSASPSDEQRVATARNGDLAAWAGLYREHFPALLRYLAYLTGDVDEAEDLAQEAFSIALIKLHQFDGRASFRAWVRGIATNLLRRQRRKHGRRRRAYSRLEQTESRRARPTSHDPEGRIVRDRRAAALRDALEALPLSLREAFVLTDIQGLSSDEVASALEISPGNARVRASRARGRIKRFLVERGHVAVPPADAQGEVDA